MSRRAALLAGAAAAAAIVGAVAVVARPEAPAAGSLDGRVLFADKGCATCHASASGEASIPGVAPPLDDIAAWAGERVDGLSAEEYVTQSIATPSAFVSPAWAGPSGPMTHMPTLPLTGEEIAALVDYLLEPTSDGQG